MGGGVGVCAATGVDGGRPSSFFGRLQENLMGGGVGVCASLATVCHGVCAGPLQPISIFTLGWRVPNLTGGCCCDSVEYDD